MNGAAVVAACIVAIFPFPCSLTPTLYNFHNREREFDLTSDFNVFGTDFGYICNIYYIYEV